MLAASGLICKLTVRLVFYRRMERAARSPFCGEYGGGVYYVLDPDGAAARQEIARDTPPQAINKIIDFGDNY